MLPFNLGGMLSGLVCGFLFGYVLENAGFGSTTKLTAQFRLSDWSVFKVMFTAIVVAAVGLWLLRLVGVMRPDAVFVPQALVLASAVGGALVGAGFALGGYCPGTSVVGLSSGRLDALAFVVGLLAGTSLFAALFGRTLRGLMAIGEVIDGDTVVDAYGVPEVVVLGILVLCLVGIFKLGAWFERRGQGPVRAADVVSAQG